MKLAPAQCHRLPGSAQPYAVESVRPGDRSAGPGSATSCYEGAARHPHAECARTTCVVPACTAGRGAGRSGTRARLALGDAARCPQVLLVLSSGRQFPGDQTSHGSSCSCRNEVPQGRRRGLAGRGSFPLSPRTDERAPASCPLEDTLEVLPDRRPPPPLQGLLPCEISAFFAPRRRFYNPEPSPSTWEPSLRGAH